MRCCVRRVRDLRAKIVYTLLFSRTSSILACDTVCSQYFNLFPTLPFSAFSEARACLVFCMPLLNGHILLTSLHMFRYALHKTCRMIVKCETVRCLLESIIDTRMVVIVNCTVWHHHISATAFSTCKLYVVQCILHTSFTL